MTSVKSEILMTVYSELGATADNWKKGAEVGAAQNHGASEALQKAAVAVSVTAARQVKQDLDAGKLSGMDPEDIAKYTIAAVREAHNYLKSQSEQCARTALALAGEIAAHERLAGYMEKLVEHEAKGVERRRAALQSGAAVMAEDGSLETVEGARLPGARPATTDVAARKAEEKARRKAEREEAAPEEVPEESVVPPAKPVRRKAAAKKASKKKE